MATKSTKFSYIGLSTTKTIYCKNSPPNGSLLLISPSPPSSRSFSHLSPHPDLLSTFDPAPPQPLYPTLSSLP